jgi:8-oxo-dGTP pyrophosphatase MutT (NUDIX family)
MENGETTTQAAARETLEEANARIDVLGLYAMYNLPYIDQVQLLFRATLLDLDFSPGVESLEVELFGEDEIPWDTLAFRPIRSTLENFFADRKRGEFSFRNTDLAPPKRPL